MSLTDLLTIKRFVSSEKCLSVSFEIVLCMSLMKSRKGRGSNTDPGGTPCVTSVSGDLSVFFCAKLGTVIKVRKNPVVEVFLTP